MLDANLKQYSNYSSHVCEIIKPLHSVGIVGLFYMRVYSDGTVINLASDASWTEFYFKQLLSGNYQDKDINDQCFSYPGVSLWELNLANQIWQDGKNYFGYGNGVTICEDFHAFREIMGFYSTAENHRMNHFYINNMDLILKFKEYFLSNASELVKKYEQCKSEFNHLAFKQKVVKPDLKNHELITKISSRKTQKENYFVSNACLFHKNTSLPVMIPNQQAKCLLHLLQGNSAKKIARLMDLSPKTIEYYLDILRNKLGCQSSRELIIFYDRQMKAQFNH